jgi:hypothetical protein
MSDASRIVDAYLRTRFATDLEQLLLEAASGDGAASFGEGVAASCDPAGTEVFDDGGMVDHYEGRLTIEGVAYRFRCSVFTEGGGVRFVESLPEFEPVDWGTTLVVMPRGRRAPVAESPSRRASIA